MGVMSERTCPCGRGLPLLEKVHGRIADFLVRKDGSLVAGVSLVERTLTAFSGIQQMQIMQNDLDTIILNIVRDEDYGKNTEQLLVSEFSDVFGPSVKIIFNYISSLAAEKNGKHRFSISKLESKYSVLQ
jgi:phenylacetate-CoA ligase